MCACVHPLAWAPAQPPFEVLRETWRARGLNFPISPYRNAPTASDSEKYYSAGAAPGVRRGTAKNAHGYSEGSRAVRRPACGHRGVVPQPHRTISFSGSYQ